MELKKKSQRVPPFSLGLEKKEMCLKANAQE